MAVQKAKYIWRDYETDGVAASGFHKPIPRDLRTWGANVEQMMLGTASGVTVYDSKADMDADTSQSANSMGWVIGDDTAANDGIYRFDGTDTWTRLGDLPDGAPGSSDVVGTSQTSLAIAIGSKTFAIEEDARGWGTGARLRASSDANAANWMEGLVTNYANDSLTISVDLVGGSGTKADWTINLAGEQGEKGGKGDTGATGATGAKGDKGDTGSTGASGTITSATASGLAAGAAPTITLGGTASARTMAFGIPAGATGAKGDKGDKGDTGDTGPAGADGAPGDGSGDVVGPSSSTDDDIMVADGATGKKIKDGGVTVSFLRNAGNLNAGTLPDGRLPSRIGTISNAVVDWNDATTNGWYHNDANPSTNPPPTTTPFLTGYVVAHSATYCVQTVWEATGTVSSDSRMWRRVRKLSVWGDWYRLRISEAELDARYALLASPALTGTPTAPTAASSTNTTQIATTAFVKAALAALVDSSPAALDTLNELAAALGDDPNFATTMTNALADKLAATGGTLTNYSETVNALGTVGASPDIDLTDGNVVTATVDSTAPTFTFSNPAASGKCSSFTLFLTNGGLQTITWPAAVSWGDAGEPTLSAAAVDILTFETLDGGTTWYGHMAGSGF